MVIANDNTYGVVGRSYFSLLVTKCPDTATATSVATSALDYFTPGTSQSYVFNSFTTSDAICSFSYEIFESDGVTAFNTSRIASFNSVTRTITVNTNDPALINTIYTVVIKGTLNNDVMTTVSTTV